MKNTIAITITHLHNGLSLTTVVNGYLVHKFYQGYSQKQARADFRAFIASQA